MKKFFVGWHQPNNGESGTKHFENCLISVNRLINRRSCFLVNNWILDSGSFGRLVSGKGHLSIKKYASLVKKWGECGNLEAAVCQDYLCEDKILNITNLSLAKHQELTIFRYDRLLKELERSSSVYIMPVLQGFQPEDYLTHLFDYGDRLASGAWVGVGSVCSRSKNVDVILSVLKKIKYSRPDLRLHGFGLKLASLKCFELREMLYSADSQAHSFGQNQEQTKFFNANDPYAALLYYEKIFKLNGL